MKKQKVKKDIKELLDNISEKEVLKLRECSCDKNGFDDYVYLSLIHISEPTRPY